MPRQILCRTALFALCGAIACSGETTPGAAAPAATTPVAAASKVNASLTCEGGTFSKFRVKNVKARRYQRDSFSQACELTDKAEGVIWVATGDGYALQDADKKLTFKDDRGRQFGHTCWTSSGTINGVTQTEVILFGPEDSKKVMVCCGENCADTQME